MNFKIIMINFLHAGVLPSQLVRGRVPALPLLQLLKVSLTEELDSHICSHLQFAVMSLGAGKGVWDGSAAHSTSSYHWPQTPQATVEAWVQVGLKTSGNLPHFFTWKLRTLSSSCVSLCHQTFGIWKVLVHYIIQNPNVDTVVQVYLLLLPQQGRLSVLQPISGVQCWLQVSKTVVFVWKSQLYHRK